MQQIVGGLWSRTDPEWPALNDEATAKSQQRPRNQRDCSPNWGGALSHGTGLLLQLGSDFLEEPGCSIGEGPVAHIARFGIAAEAAIFPKSDPIARIHSVFGIDQMLQALPHHRAYGSRTTAVRLG